MHEISPRRVTLNRLRTAGIVALLLLGIISALYMWMHRESMFSSMTAADKKVSLLQSGWRSLGGITPQADGLHVTNSDQPIVRQDGTLGMTRPAVNLYGSHLYADADYTLSATIQDLNKSAILRLYSSVPLTQDEFYTNPKNIEFIVTDDNVTMNTWASNRQKNPYTQMPLSSITRSISSQPTHTLTLVRHNNRLTVFVDDVKVSQLAYNSAFDREVWFGFSTQQPDDTWTLSALNLTTNADNRVAVINSETMSTQPTPAHEALQTLATLKRPDFQVGVAGALAPTIGDESYRSIVYGGNFGRLTTENALKWQFIHPQPSKYNFTEADALVTIARQHNMSVQGHALVFGEANPAWVQSLTTQTDNDKANIKQIMTDHITQTVGHFKGRVTAWDVVNEPLSDDDNEVSLRSHVWFKAMGESYIATALQAAHQADPQAMLYINDWGLEADGERWDAMLDLVTRLKAANVPIDGVGFQAHVYEEADMIDPAVLREHIKALAAIGVTAHISEMDVYSDNGTDVQAQQYRDIFAACFNEPNCTSWTTWGASDRYNLYLDDNERIAMGQDFLWDSDMQPTPAVTMLQEFLRSK